jgi:hypothetical protein
MFGQHAWTVAGRDSMTPFSQTRCHAGNFKSPISHHALASSEPPVAHSSHKPFPLYFKPRHTSNQSAPRPCEPPLARTLNQRGDCEPPLSPIISPAKSHPTPNTFAKPTFQQHAQPPARTTKCYCAPSHRERQSPDWPSTLKPQTRDSRLHTPTNLPLCFPLRPKRGNVPCTSPPSPPPPTSSPSAEP